MERGGGGEGGGGIFAKGKMVPSPGETVGFGVTMIHEEGTVEKADNRVCM